MFLEYLALSFLHDAGRGVFLPVFLPIFLVWKLLSSKAGYSLTTVNSWAEDGNDNYDTNYWPNFLQSADSAAMRSRALQDRTSIWGFSSCCLHAKNHSHDLQHLLGNNAINQNFVYGKKCPGRLGGSVGWTSNFSSGHDLAVCEFGLCADSSESGACFGLCVSLSLSPLSAHALSLSLSLSLSKISIKKN